MVSVIRDHENIVNKSRDRIKRLEQKTATSAAKYSKELSMRMNEPIRKCYQNEKKCDAEVRTLITESTALLELNQQWKNKIESFDQALRELGDVQAYTYAIERETRILLNVTNKIMTANKNQSPNESIETETTEKEPSETTE